MPTVGAPLSKRPWHLSPWFLGFVGLLIVMLLGVTAGLWGRDSGAPQKQVDISAGGTFTPVNPNEGTGSGSPPTEAPSVEETLIPPIPGLDEVSRGGDPLFTIPSDPPSPAPPPPTPPASQEPPPLSDEIVAQHLEACGQQRDVWISGQLTYPPSLAVPINESVTYEVRIDINPGATDQPAPESRAAVDALKLRCALGARLIDPDDGVAIEKEGEWIHREFDPSGFVEWFWDVRVIKPDDTEVRLELRPAIPDRDGRWVVPGPEDSRAPTVTYTTGIDMQAGVVDQADSWFKTEWPKIVGIGVVIGAALIGIIAWGRKLIGVARGREATEEGGNRASAAAATESPMPKPRREQSTVAAPARKPRPRRNRHSPPQPQPEQAARERDKRPDIASGADSD